ncbi:asparaginase domain-containing protein, partial [Streptomyces sp. NPDC059455]|uniref:asparaginase domain-containing protein n=1 Tax=Streptomyces sp. NPDC059455 TaxID=3346837 RepID=UPI0036857169
MRRIVVLSTGGTIATRQDAHGTRLAAESADALLERLPWPPGVAIEARDVFCLGSYLLTPADMHGVALAVREALADESVAGVVVTHGTDSLEETAYLVDLFHGDARPVVFTGAMRPADAPDGDGPRNLADAIAGAVPLGAPARGGGGGLLGQGEPPPGTRKGATTAPRAVGGP